MNKPVWVHSTHQFIGEAVARMNELEEIGFDVTLHIMDAAKPPVFLVFGKKRPAGLPGDCIYKALEFIEEIKEDPTLTPGVAESLARVQAALEDYWA